MRSVSKVSFTVLIQNTTAFQYSRLPYYHSSFTLTPANSLSSQPTNLGIYDIFASALPSNFDQNCAVSVSKILLTVVSSPWKVHLEMANLSNRTQIIPSGQDFESNYKISCYNTECTLGTYFDALNNICAPCPAGCLDCYNTAYCLNCSSSYYLIQSTCIPCSFAVTDCLTCEVNMTLGQYNCTSCVAPFYLASINQC